jgi:hypothetical protein
MKTIYRNLFFIALSTLLCLFLAVPANAQRPGTSGGGGGNSGGGSRPAPSGGGGGSVSRPSVSSGGGGSVSRPSFNGGGSAPRPSFNNGGNRGSVGVSRPSFNNRGVGIAPQSYGNRSGTGYAPRPGIGARGNYGYAQRPGVSANGYAPRVGYTPRGYTSGGGGYRTSPTIGYGRGGYWGNHGYYHYNHGYYGSYYLPRIGFTCAVLPYGYYPFYWGDYEYYYSDGLYYQYTNNQYTVVEPPVGAEVASLPDKAQSIVINGQQYYELNGVYYQPITKDDGTVVYMIAGKDGELNTTDSTVQDQQPQGPQMGDIVYELPQDCRKIKVNGEVLYVSPDGIYYQQQVDSSGNKSYKIVGLPSDEPESNQN